MEAHQIHFSVHGTPAAARSARQQLANGIRGWDTSLPMPGFYTTRDTAPADGSPPSVESQLMVDGLASGDA